MSRETLQVFISYARADGAAFAEELQVGLKVAGFNAFLDRHDIAAGEVWEARLAGLIETADTIVFVITPASVASERCRWELDRAIEQSKRVIPIVLSPVEEAATPEALRRLNYIFFNDGRSYSRALSELSDALRVDLAWIREHSRLAEIARRWNERKHSSVLLLRGSELESARAWISDWRAPAPEPTDFQRALIAASEEAESAVILRERSRQRRVLAVVGAAAIAFAGVAILAGVMWQGAERAKEEARAALSTAFEVALKRGDDQMEEPIQVGKVRQALDAYAAAKSLLPDRAAPEEIAALNQRISAANFALAGLAGLARDEAFGCEPGRGDQKFLETSLQSARVWAAATPEQVEAHLALGCALRALSRPTEAVPAFKAAADLDPDDVSVMLELARAQSDSLAWSDARDSYQRALEIAEPGSDIAEALNVALANATWQAGDKGAALALLGSQIEGNSEFAPAHLRRAALLMADSPEKDMLSGIERDLKIALGSARAEGADRSRIEAEAQYLLSRLFMLQRAQGQSVNAHRAVNYALRAAAADPSEKQYWINACEVSAALGQTDVAARYCTDHPAASGPEALFALGLSQLQRATGSATKFERDQALDAAIAEFDEARDLLNQIGDDSNSADTLRARLAYGRAFVLICSGLIGVGNKEIESISPAERDNVRKYFSERKLVRCPVPE